ncbi:hypothetical protein TMM008_04900 [Pseudomonas sp. 008]|nr:hypothetical protein TMM008_04900 [Pseudomonas sp. 008]
MAWRKSPSAAMQCYRAVPKVSSTSSRCLPDKVKGSRPHRLHRSGQKPIFTPNWAEVRRMG